jgi:uncharacterized Zn-finger protein
MSKIDKVIYCSGDLESTSKHPTIYMKLGQNNKATCPYCSKYFQLTTKNKKTFIAAYDPSKT